tara:strand:+ start:1335 stop:2318 length:984 start_codon:yes stop_codon:yes gene_type:complete
MKNILVTGAAGFIGFHLIKRLCSNNFAVVGIDNINDYYDINLKNDRLRNLEYKNFIFLNHDLSRDDFLDEIFIKHKFDTVIHLAAQAGVRYSIENPLAYGESNLTGFINIIEASRKFKVNNFLYASSSSVYGRNKETPFKESHKTENIVSLYAATKKSNEIIAETFSKMYSLPVIGLRFFTVYGPFGRPDMAYFKFTKSILEGKEIEIFNNGELYRDFTHIDDIVEGIIKILERIENTSINNNENLSKIFNIGRGNPIKLTDFIEELEINLNKSAKKIYVEMQLGDVFKTYADIRSLQDFCGYNPKVDFKSGIKDFVNWYLSYYHNE